MRFLLLIAIVVPNLLWGQVSLERQVLAPFAVNGLGSYYISSTGGQVEYTTGGLETILTQGFEQPPSASLIVDVVIDYPACGEEAEMQIADVIGCADQIEQVIIDDVVYSPGSIFLPAGEYNAQIEAGTGCSTSITFTIDPELLVVCDIFFPNIVTNNGDLANDFWEIQNIHLPHFSPNQVIIYNRWGQKVWEGIDYDNSSVRWEGKDNDGKDLPVGTYFYEFKAPNELIFEGFIELFR